MNTHEEVAFSVIMAQHAKWDKFCAQTTGCPHSALVLRLKSSVKLSCCGKTILSNPGEITYVPANAPYTAEYDDNVEMIFIHFTESVPFFTDVQNFSPPHFEQVYSLFSKVVSICNSKKQNYKIEAASAFLQIIVYLLKLKSNSITNTAFEKAIKIIKEEYQNPDLSISSVCKKANISDSHLRKLFSAEFGMSPIRYLNELRIDHAQKLLYSNYCTVETAAIKSGFSDYRYFSRVTKKLRGCTPSMLRTI